jgi:hypothetical protein
LPLRDPDDDDDDEEEHEGEDAPVVRDREPADE